MEKLDTNNNSNKDKNTITTWLKENPLYNLRSNSLRRSPKRESREAKALLRQWLTENPLYRFRPKKNLSEKIQKPKLVQGLCGNVWACDRCTYWHYNKKAIHSHMKNCDV